MHDYHVPFPRSLREQPFDIVLCASCFDFCRGLDTALKNLSNVLRPGGALFFTVDELRPELPLHDQPVLAIPGKALSISF